MAVCVLAAACRSPGGVDPGPAVPREEPIASYRVTYALREAQREALEDVVVRRPYESRRTTSVGSAIVAGTISNREGLFQYGSGSSSWRLVDPGRRRAEADAHVLGSLAFLMRRGLATLHGQRSVQGRPCTVLRTRMPVGNPAREAPSAKDHAELCVDRTGVVLTERWVIGGRLARERRLVRFEPGAALADNDFRAEPLDQRAVPDIVLVPQEDAAKALRTVTFDLPDGVQPDGEVATVTRSLDGARGRLLRFYRTSTDLVDVQELAAGEPPTVGAPETTDMGAAYFDSDVGRVTVTVVLQRSGPASVTVLMRGGTLALLQDMVRAMRRTPAEPPRDIGTS